MRYNDIVFRKLNKKGAGSMAIKFDTSKLLGKIIEKYGSQRELAKSIGVNTTTLSRKLNGYSNFSLQEAYKISKALDIPSEEINTYFFTFSCANPVRRWGSFRCTCRSHGRRAAVLR